MFKAYPKNYGGVEVNSNIRCIEMFKAYPKNYGGVEVNSNIRCIEIYPRLIQLRQILR